MSKTNFCCTWHTNPKIVMCVRNSTPEWTHQFVLRRITFFETVPGAFLPILALGSRPNRALTTVNMFDTATRPKHNQSSQKSLCICAWVCRSIKYIDVGGAANLCRLKNCILGCFGTCDHTCTHPKNRVLPKNSRSRHIPSLKILCDHILCT